MTGTHASNKIGLVLSGGGARGAYEVGVLDYVFHHCRGPNGEQPNIRLISGTSVGAVNGTLLASGIEDMRATGEYMVRLWEDLELSHVLNFGVRQFAGLYRVFVGGADARGIFGTMPLSEIVGRSIHWRNLRDNIRSNRLTALTVSTTRVSTGQPVFFIDAADGVGLPQGLSLHALVRRARIGQHHVLASAAIPLLFPVVQIGDEVHCDGGLRLNTPVAPAIHLGMDKLLVISVSTLDHSDETRLDVSNFPGAAFMLGKVLNAFMLDHVNTDVLGVKRVNDFLRDGITAFGPEFLDKLNAAALARGAAAPRRMLHPLVLRPSLDIGQVASQYLRSNRVRFGKVLGRAFLGLLDSGQAKQADLASYLLFDGAFAAELIRLGRRDAHENRAQISEFLWAAPSDLI